MRIHGLLPGLAASLLVYACGAGDEGTPADDAAGVKDGASEQAEAVQSIGESDNDLQSGSQALGCQNVCTAVSTVDLTGVCCICQGVQKTFHRSVFNRNVYLCQ